MWRKKLSLGVAGPTILVSLFLLGLCTVTAVLLYRQQAKLAHILEEAIGSRKKASELETTIRNLAGLLKQGHTQVEALESQFHSLLVEAEDYANTDVEVRLVGKLERSFEHYRAAWPADVKPGETGRLQAALRVLEADTLPLCNELRSFNQSEIERSEAQIRDNLQWMAWGLVAIGAIGSCGGILLGYGMARALRHSIHQLSVRIRDAADRLPQELPTVTLTSGRNIDHLNEQIHALVPQIEQVVEKLQQREREVLRAKQLAAVGQLAAGVAHELRNPLTAIKMLVQSSRDDMQQRGLAAEDLETIELEIRRLERCLQTFLDFARPPKMECHTIDLVREVEQVLTLLAGRARKQQVELKFSRPGAPVLIDADGAQLRQVLINLCLNSLDVMPRGGLLELAIRQEARGQVEVDVIDTGPGIAAEVLPRLFEPFVSSKETGLGLGLVVSRRIAEDHGGSLWGRNRPQGGACFTLRLPRQTRAGVPAPRSLEPVA
jgi:signal transduction histidine kinase